MKVHVLQHVPFEGLGSIETWLSEKETDVQYTRFYESSASLPDPRTVDFVIAMGGPMSVNEEQKYPWLKPEKQFIHEVVLRGVPVVGVCLGGQLIASALGARVYANTRKEIGWFPIEAVDTDRDVFHFPPHMMVFHWHSETFDLPPGAVCLASSAVCKNQAFQIGKNVIGLQFHLDTTPETLDLIVENCRDELVVGTYIQTEEEMRAIPKFVYAEINKVMDNVLSYITQIGS